MTARDELRREMTHNHLHMTDERADELIDACIAEALRDPAHREALAEILRREARINPAWLNDFVRQEARRQGSSLGRLRL